VYQVCVTIGHIVFWFLWRRSPDKVPAHAKATLGGAVLGVLLGLLIGSAVSVQTPETYSPISPGAALGGVAGLFFGALAGFALAKRDPESTTHSDSRAKR
jgi:outer membrane protein with glycine zipper